MPQNSHPKVSLLAICDVLHYAAILYRDYFVNNDFLLISAAFVNKPIFEVSAKEEHFLHLTGLISHSPAKTFFRKCYEGTIKPDDFIFKENRSHISKLHIIEQINNVFSNPNTLVQENFQRNTISCTIATSEKTFTLGFTRPNVVVPMTLLKGNKLDMSLAKPILLTLRKDRHTRLYDEIVFGDISILREYYPIIKHRLSERLINLIENQ